MGSSGTADVRPRSPGDYWQPPGPRCQSAQRRPAQTRGAGELGGLRPRLLRGRGAGSGDAQGCAKPRSATAPRLRAAFLPGAVRTRTGRNRWGCHGSSSLTDRHFLAARGARAARASEREVGARAGVHLNPRGAAPTLAGSRAVAQLSRPRSRRETAGPLGGFPAGGRVGRR